MINEPLLPVLDVPKQKLSIPRTPLVAEFTVQMVTMPFDVNVPSTVAKGELCCGLSAC